MDPSAARTHTNTHAHARVHTHAHKNTHAHTCEHAHAHESLPQDVGMAFNIERFCLKRARSYFDWCGNRPDEQVRALSLY
jgi:hypothetical protein